MADEYDPDIVESMLEECLNQMRIQARRSIHEFPREITRLVRELADLAKVRPKQVQAPLVVKEGEGEKKVISARACVVCGRDDRPGEARKSGFKCHECIGLPSQSNFVVEVEEFDSMSQTFSSSGDRVVNDFSFTRHLGSGAFGKVKLAVHNKSQQQYAVKILDKSSLMRVHGAIEKVHQEIRIMKAMNHPNIIKIYTIIDDPDEYKMYLVMEFLEGGQVYDLDLDKVGTPVARERLKKHIVGIAQGLQYLHGKGIVHRDIKPENILLDKHDNVKLADFGVSSTCEHGTETMTSTEGSPAFLPPEEWKAVPVQGRAQDVWAFGVTLYVMAFGKLPFFARTRKELEDLVLNHEPDYPADADPLLVDLMKKMLQKEQNDRPALATILEHPLVADVRCVKGFPVETITANLAVVDANEATNPPEDAQALVVRQPGESKGSTELLNFLSTEGPEFQLVRGGVYSVTLYSIKSDPRRKQQRKYMETWAKKNDDKAEGKRLECNKEIGGESYSEIDGKKLHATCHDKQLASTKCDACSDPIPEAKDRLHFQGKEYHKSCLDAQLASEGGIVGHSATTETTGGGGSPAAGSALALLRPNKSDATPTKDGGGSDEDANNIEAVKESSLDAADRDEENGSPAGSPTAGDTSNANGGEVDLERGNKSPTG